MTIDGLSNIIIVAKTICLMEANAVNERIKRLMNERNCSIKELAEWLDVSPSYIYKILSGERKPQRVDMLKRIAIRLNTTMDYLLYGFNLDDTSKNQNPLELKGGESVA